MTTEEVIEKIKKNQSLNRSEKKELIEFWKGYTCPAEKTLVIECVYHDGEKKEYSVGNRLEQFYDETPRFIEDFFKAMAEGRPYTTRFGTYKPLPRRNVPRVS